MPAKKKKLHTVQLDLDLDLSEIEKAVSDAFRYLGDTVHDYLYEDINRSVAKAVGKVMNSAPMQNVLEDVVREILEKEINK